MGDGKKLRDSSDRPSLVDTLSGRRVLYVSAGYTHTCAVIEGGSLVTWGSAVSGKLGLGEYTDEHECFCPTPTPVTIPAGRRVRGGGGGFDVVLVACLLSFLSLFCFLRLLVRCCASGV